MRSMVNAVMAHERPGTEPPMSWALIAGEYPPQSGGVADYTRGLARMLAAGGDSVRVFAPPCDAASMGDDRVSVQRLPDVFGPRSRSLLHTALMNIPRPRAAILQYVPQSFGMRGCNIPFAAWLRSLHGYPLWVMFHEVTVTVRPSTALKYRVQAFATDLMAKQVIAASDTALVSTERWTPLLHTLSSRVPDVTCLPIPSNIALHADAETSREVRARFADSGVLYGHFGTYRDAAMRQVLLAAVPRLLSQMHDGRMLFVGTGSDVFASALTAACPSIRDRVFGAGALPPDLLAAHLTACDVLLQPYEDGVTTRRTSIVAALALGSAVVTTSGPMTERLWPESRAVALVPDNDVDALVESARTLGLDAARRAAMGALAREFYEQTFTMEQTVNALRGLAWRELQLA
jgi:glycosyltransferase involved in cell wall biosynthesis